ncbi:hypothetical protein ACX1HT_18155 [Yersinia enterocolitica]
MPKYKAEYEYKNEEKSHEFESDSHTLSWTSGEVFEEVSKLCGYNLQGGPKLSPPNSLNESAIVKTRKGLVVKGVYKLNEKTQLWDLM